MSEQRSYFAKMLEKNEITKSIRVLVSSRHALVRCGIRTLLERVDGLKVYETEDNKHVFDAIERTKPDVIFVEIVTPGSRGIESVTDLAQRFPNRVIALVPHENKKQVVHLLRLGLAGLIAKSDTSAELELTIKAVARGERYVSAALRGHLNRRVGDSRPFVPDLTLRQYEVLKSMVEGNTIKEIAQSLNISVKTAETHRTQVMQRLEIYDTAGLVRYALKIGLIDLDDG